MTTSQALIIGASRGIGLGLANILAERGWQVTATMRKQIPSAASGIRWLTLDINMPDERKALKEQLAGQQFDVIFINAGVYGPGHQKLSASSDDELMALFMTNTFSPLRCAEELLPNVKPQTGIVALMSSQLASLNENSDATYPLYAASKGALNMLARGLSAQTNAQGQTLLCVHPGWVQTDMGGKDAPLTVAQSASGIADQLAAWRGKGGHHFVGYDGELLAW
ncbi:SDR family oxidoreductase [Erwinia sorbitola]|uniref:SDR family oxidoreductase n=1 Tax=Erwinia sorbitola TaxID=2681984 RepID=A0A6I6EF27_9GAMM|nr:SDR family oxidoreductase [Erwinia sorbitola]QGU88494.1 SDR family oxidoreductase [Erwinia sorbitola]